jgi:hypothetical protein
VVHIAIPILIANTSPSWLSYDFFLTGMHHQKMDDVSDKQRLILGLLRLHGILQSTYLVGLQHHELELAPHPSR